MAADVANVWGRTVWSKMRVYYDNVIVSGRALNDLVPPSEMEAVSVIEAAHRAGLIKRV